MDGDGDGGVSGNGSTVVTNLKAKTFLIIYATNCSNSLFFLEFDRSFNKFFMITNFGWFYPQIQESVKYEMFCLRCFERVCMNARNFQELFFFL